MKWPRSPERWIAGHHVRLLENGEEFFPAVFDAVAAARQEVQIETFILFEDKVGQALHATLLQAARRGVRVDLLVDGFGSPDLSPSFVGALTDAGVRVHVFDPGSSLFGVRTNMFRRMHRKIVVVDGKRAFVGGINYSADHLADFGPEAKQDYAVELRGPVVARIHRFALENANRATDAGTGSASPHTKRHWWSHTPADAPGPASDVAQGEAGSAQVLFVTRDNRDHRDDIERHYRLALRTARVEVIIANAYFFPGYRLLREMRRAARRGVRVRLILQGEPDIPIVKVAAGMLYDHLLRSGVRIFEYCKRPLHGKVALADQEWSTVGSSNLDPLSLSLNLEANVIIRDQAFNQHLRERLENLIEHSCSEVRADPAVHRSWSKLALSYLAFHLVRRFPSWAGWLPKHEPRVEHIEASGQGRPVTAVAANSARLIGADRVHEPLSPHVS